jgi:hypothetical protein
MKQKKVFVSIAYSVTFLVLLIAPEASALANDQPSVSTVFAVVLKRLDTKNASVNQELTLRTITDVTVNGIVVIASGSTVVGHVVESATKGKESQQSILAIVIDKAVLENGRQIPLQAIIAAVAAPQDSALPADPTYGMMHSNEPKMVASGPRAGDLSASSKADSTAAVSTAKINGEMRKGLLLNTDSNGAIGFSNLSLTWRLDSPPPVSVFSSNNKEIKFEAGTQVLLRMAPPRQIGN